MKIKPNLAFGELLMLSLNSNAQAPESKQLLAQRTFLQVKIDGNVYDAAWKDAVIASGFIEFRPKVGALENPSSKSLYQSDQWWDGC